MLILVTNWEFETLLTDCWQKTQENRSDTENHLLFREGVPEPRLSRKVVMRPTHQPHGEQFVLQKRIWGVVRLACFPFLYLLTTEKEICFSRMHCRRLPEGLTLEKQQGNEGGWLVLTSQCSASQFSA